MAGKKGLAAKSGQRLLDDLAYRELYLSKIREGTGRKDAAELCGMAYNTVWRYARDNPVFLEEIQDAEAESVEGVYRFWHQVMNDPEIPWKDRLKASENLERARGRDQKKDTKVIKHQHEHELVLGGDQIEEIMALQQRIAERQELEAVTIDITPIDESDTQT